jgi:hypothetical protein
MKIKLVVLTILIMVAAPCHSEFIDSTGGNNEVLVTIPAIQPITSVKKNLRKHHISLTWYGFSKASPNMNFSYLDAREGEGAYVQYRYSFSRKIDAVVDGRGWMNEIFDDSCIYKVKSQVVGSGFGIRYNFNNYKAIFPYAQINVYRTVVEVESSVDLYHHPKLYDAKWKRHGKGWSAAVNGGAEFRLGKLISVPIDISYFYCNPKIMLDGVDDGEYFSRLEKFNFSAAFLSVGVSFNWGKLE